MKKRELTPEQIAARDARRLKFRALSKRIAAMPPDERAALAAKMPAIATIEGRALSPFNCCLIIYQRDACTIVGGFRQWLKHGRAVKKGEHGAQIWVPTGAKGKSDAAEMPEDSDSGSDCRFIAGTVFDVSQTQEIEAGAPVAVVSPEIADAFGMRGLPNVRIEEPENAPVLKLTD